MGRAVTVLYEDQLAKGPSGNFGPHSLLLACVADVLGEEAWALKRRIVASPKKGVDKVVAACRKDLRLLARDGRWVVAVVDGDRVRQHLKLKDTATDDEVVEKLRSESNDQEHLSVVVLDPNLERVVQAAGDCDRALDKDLVSRVLSKESLNERDILLNRIAWASSSVRDCILEAVPGFKLLRDRVLCAIR